MHPIRQHPLQAIGMMLVSVFLFSTMDVVFKMLVVKYGSLQVTLFRCATAMPLLMIWILAIDRSQFKTAYPVGHLFRAALGLGMLYSVGECFREMQLTDAYAIFFAAPLIITLLSGPILGEPAGVFRITASLAGFSGVLVVLNPTGASWIGHGALMGIVAVILYAFSSLLLRRLGHKDGAVTISFWFVTLVGAGAGLMTLPSWQPLDYSDWPLLLILGITGASGQVLLTAAFRRASAAVVAPFDYSHMLWAVIYGYIFWDYLPGMQTWIGSAILITSGLLILYRERRSMQQQVSIVAGN